MPGMNVLQEMLAKACFIFEKSGVLMPKLDAEVLLAHILECKRYELYMTSDIGCQAPSITLEQQKKFERYVARRTKREPIAYILGQKEFWSIPIRVTPDVLIPRPETEHLVERALVKIPADKVMHILDVGTGSGCIIAALAKERPLAQFVGIDTSERALAVAKENLQFAKKRVDLVSKFKIWNLKFDIVLSNPPYIPTPDLKNLMPDVKNYEPLSALDGGSDGLAIYRQILQNAPKRLKKGGWLLLEMGIGQEKALRKLLKENHFDSIQVTPDLAGIPRVIEGEWLGE